MDFLLLSLFEMVGGLCKWVVGEVSRISLNVSCERCYRNLDYLLKWSTGIFTYLVFGKYIISLETFHYPAISTFDQHECVHRMALMLQSNTD